MKKIFFLILFLTASAVSGCTSLHNDQGWDHKGDPKTHEDRTPYLLEHKH